MTRKATSDCVPGSVWRAHQCFLGLWYGYEPGQHEKRMGTHAPEEVSMTRLGTSLLYAQRLKHKVCPASSLLGASGESWDWEGGGRGIAMILYEYTKELWTATQRREKQFLRPWQAQSDSIMNNTQHGPSGRKLLNQWNSHQRRSLAKGSTNRRRNEARPKRPAGGAW